MKKLTNVIKINFFLLMIGTLFNTYASEVLVGTLSSVKGKVFVSYKGKLKEAKTSEQIHDNSEIMTELSSQVTLVDYHEHRFHLSGGTHLRITDNRVELLRGYLWVQSFNPKNITEIMTANSRIYFKNAEVIVSYNQDTTRTQTVVVSGEIEFGHALENYKRELISEGKFSFIDNQIDGGSPRVGTAIGYTSFQKMTELFDGVKPLKITKQVNRLPASVGLDVIAVDETKLPENDIFMKNPKKIQKQKKDTASSIMSTEDLLVDYYQNKIKELKGKKVAISKNTKSLNNRAPASVSDSKPRVVEIKIYGRSLLEGPERRISEQKNTKKTMRTPASVLDNNIFAPNINQDAFENRLTEEYIKQRRHSNETEKLINELKSYKVDFKNSY